MIRPLLLTIAVALPGAVTAADRTSREVRPDGAGAQRLEVDAALLSASARGDLSDLRLRDASGREVPYLLVPPSAPLGTWVRAAALPVRATKKESGFEVDLGAVRDVSRVRLAGLPEPFLKRFRLEGSGDRTRWTVLVAEGTLFGLPDEGLRQTETAFARGAYRYLRVTWDDRSSARPPPPRRVEAWVPAEGAPSPAPLRVPLGVARRQSEPGVSRWALRLPGEHLPVAAVLLDVEGEHVHRQASVVEARLGEGRLQPLVLGTEVLRRVVRDDAAASALRIRIARPEELELELRVQDGDNPPLELAGVVAELDPLPWVYFESPDGRPIEAVVGDPERRVPSYDLEAVRPRLPRIRTATARLAPAAEATVTREAPPVAPAELAPGGSVDAGAFRYRREIPAAPPGLAAIRLDAAVLARSPSLGDLRIAGPAGRQVPYLLERRDEPLTVPLAPPADAVEPRLARAGATLRAVELPEGGLRDARLVLETSARVFERQVELFVDEDGKEKTPPRLVASGRWVHAVPERPAPPLSLPLPPLGTSRLLVVVLDGDNAPLPLTSARLLLPSWRLRFFHPGEPLELLYGAKEVGAPRYDLALLAPRLRSAPAREVELAGAASDAGAPTEPGRGGRILFWLVLGAAVLVLLALLARLLGKGGGEAPPAARG